MISCYFLWFEKMTVIVELSNYEDLSEKVFSISEIDPLGPECSLVLFISYLFSSSFISYKYSSN